VATRLPFLIVASAAAVVACSNGSLKPPVSDKNFDDPDDPNKSGEVVVPDASGDGSFLLDGSGKACTKQEDCAAPLRCIFPIALGCGATGSCALYADAAGCGAKTACACDGTVVSLCAPDGYAPKPVGGACTDAAAAHDAAADGPSE
jgi:hypothetical protein